MEMLYHLLSLVAAIFQFETANCISSPIGQIDHLPTNIRPESYDLYINFDFYNNDVPFSGKVGIKIKCEENTDTLILNVKELKIVEKEVTVTLSLTEGGTPIKVINHNYNELRDQYIITLAEKLEARRKYDVNVPFRKESLVDLSDLGLVRYSYKDESDHSKRVIALSKADINDARRFFPCMDEINSKATFTIKLRVPKHLSTVSSIEYKYKFIDAGGQTEYNFKDSIPISPHSLGLAVAEIDRLEDVTSEAGLTIFIWSRASINNVMSGKKVFFNVMSERVVDFYFSYFDSPPPVKDNLGIVILPNLPQMNIPKSRLMMFDESTLFYSNSIEESEIDGDAKADIILRLCSVINRQWLDAAVDMSNWNENWVQIALATFLRAPCLEELLADKKFNPLDMQLVETFTHVLRNDGESVSRPIHVNEEHFDLTTAFSDYILFEKDYPMTAESMRLVIALLFNAIVYTISISWTAQKKFKDVGIAIWCGKQMFSTTVYDFALLTAHLLIKMMHYFIGEELFQDSMRRYHKDTESDGTSTLDKLWQVFDTKAHTKENLLPKDTTIKMIMESWVLKKGHPVINMDIDYKKGTAMLKQERFVQLEDEDNENETIRENDYWIIPVNYATKAEFKEEKQPRTHVDLWLLDGTAVTIPFISKDWALLNLQLSVPCRVNYDKDTRKLLYGTLMNTDEYKIIDEKSRIQLVFDMFALAEVGRMPYRTLLATMQYLKHEDSDLVLMVVLYELNKIHSTLFNTNMTKFYKAVIILIVVHNLQSYMKDILEKIFERPRFSQINDLSESTRQEKQVKKLVFELSCKFGVGECVKQVDHLFKKFMDMDNPDDSNIIPEEIREIFYCQAIKHGGYAEWNFLHQLYEKSTPVHQKAIVTALGYSEDNDTLEEYITDFHNLKFPPKYHQSIINGLAANEDGYLVMKDTFQFKPDEIIKNFKGYKDTIGFYLAKLFEFTNVKDDFNVLKGIIQLDSVKDQLRSVEDILKDSVRTAKKNVIWLEKYMMELKTFFQFPHLLDSLD